MARQIKAIMDALIDEVEEDERQLFASGPAQIWILNFAKMMEWTVTGDYSILPPEMAEIAREIEGNAHRGIDT